MVLDGKKVKTYLEGKYKELLENRNFHVALLKNLDDYGSVLYANQIRKNFGKFGIKFDEYDFSLKSEIQGDDAYKSLIRRLNDNPEISGIFVQMPLVNVKDRDGVIRFISENKDIEGITRTVLGNLFYNDEKIVPPTANAVIALAEFYKIDFSGKNVVIVNRSYIIGKPLIALLLKRNATVTVCHSKTEDIGNHLANADIIVSGVGRPGFITRGMVREGSVIFDLSINRKEGKTCGDCDFENLADFTDITPVPGGIGPITNLMLIKNLLSLNNLL